MSIKFKNRQTNEVISIEEYDKLEPDEQWSYEVVFDEPEPNNKDVENNDNH